MTLTGQARLVALLEGVCLLLLAVNIGTRVPSTIAPDAPWAGPALGAAVAITALAAGRMLWLAAIPTTTAAARATPPTLFGLPLRVAGHGRSPVREAAGAVAVPVLVLTGAAAFGTLALLLRPATAAGAEWAGGVARLLTLLALTTVAPGLPFDGGRLLRAMLWWWTGDLAYATRLAASAGQGLASIGMVAGAAVLLGGDAETGLALLAAAVLVHLAAAQGYEAVALIEAARGLRAGDVVLPVACTLGCGTSAAEVLERQQALSSASPVFPVVHGRSLVGVVPRDRVLAVPASRRGDVTAVQLMTPVADLACAAADQPLHRVLDWRARWQGFLPVLHGSELLGLILPDGPWPAPRARRTLPLTASSEQRAA